MNAQLPVLAVDFGGTKVEAALVAGGAVLPGTRARHHTGPNSTSQELDDAVRHVVAQARGDHEIAAVGIGSAGPVDTDRGLVSPLNLPAWRDHPLRDVVASAVPGGIPVTIAIDGLAVTLAEAYYGAGRGSANVMGMVVSTGIGGGLVLDGRGIRGKSGNAGHVGHIQVVGYDEPCPCGRVGCVEAVASGPSSVRWAQTRGWSGVTGEELAAAAPTDPIARAAVERSARAVGLAVASASALVDLDVVAIGGGFSHSAPDYLDLVRVAAHEGFPFVRATRILHAGLGTDAPLIGAGLVASDG